jgi:hypothetical protein
MRDFSTGIAPGNAPPNAPESGKNAKGTQGATQELHNDDGFPSSLARTKNHQPKV